MVLEASQEHRDHGIARHIVHTPLLEEDVRLAGRRKEVSQLGANARGRSPHSLDKQHGTPRLAHIQTIPQPLLQLISLHTQLARRHGIQRRLKQLGDRLGRQRLADSRTTMEDHNEPTALPADDVCHECFGRGGGAGGEAVLLGVAGFREGRVLLDEGADEVCGEGAGERGSGGLGQVGEWAIGRNGGGRGQLGKRGAESAKGAPL